MHEGARGWARVVAVVLLLAGAPLPGSGQDSQPSGKGPFATFFAVHMEAGTHGGQGGEYQERQWPNLVRFVTMADGYHAKLTLMFNPQWAEYILKDEEKVKRVREWQKAGHEVAIHYHNTWHGDWNGHTNRKDERFTRDPRYRGAVPEMMGLLEKLAAPDKMLSMCMGPKPGWDSVEEVEIDEPDYPEGVVYDVDGMDRGLSRLLRTKFREQDLYHLKHHFFAPNPGRREHLERIQEEFGRAGPDEVLGVVTHEADFGSSPEFIEKWFQFCREKGAEIRTVRDVVRSYPEDRIVDVEWVPQRGGVERRARPAGGALLEKVRTFQESLGRVKGKGLDTSEAEALDTASREAARGGNLEAAERLIDKAITALGRLER